ncbi:cyclopropane-fatty-acyl-phospholipid synthase [Sulfuriferula plumbiphila]|uniref:Cyclopropane-fatty-acyl-phospholipid synthase n=2 Tax=Sulfuriferula plumbiphila TaxID=171865 RepID=A0A512L5R2_9PROT|nr:class I SAM-dependent methyltransferase [Sulfuriferula plumbiphila]BBP03412.1 cyclopropane-fatty-acyl-phospholipid synthase [Sulfuriferula plumbiphila]GEP29817.1 cyclopropane-fatty-acyl-phospholipid synthase [Sulfuriferula plumbiphila]
MLDNMMINRFKSGLGGQSLPLSIRFWNGETLRFGERASVLLSLNSARAAASLSKPTLGKFARCYVEGEIDLEGDIHEILSLGEKLCAEGECLVQDKKGSQAWKWWRHTRARDRKNISYHYDVSNDFYALWLDQKRVYSCAYFRHPDDTLEAAQEAKLDHICKKLMLQSGESLLDIGCGWGGLVLWAAQHYGVHAVGITLSQNQHDYVREQVKARGLEGRVEVRLMDYRDVPPDMQFDKIASVGMFEHVGRGNLDGYFDKIFSLLKPGGLVMNHGITAAGLDSRGLGSGISEFIDDYVFPGGELVHAARVIESLARSGLECLDAENLRPHYARTLWQWVHRLEAHSSEARRLIGEQKYRIWRIYMAGSAHAFDRGWMALFQILAGKPLANGSLPYPFTRDHVYT